MRAAVITPVPASVSITRDRLRSLLPPFILSLAFASVLIIIPPLGEFPVSDDWVHTWAVQSLLERGRPEISPWAAVSLVLQIYWGALFVHLFGFSFLALRASTLVLSILALFGSYALLREYVDARWSLAGSLLLLFNPLYIYFSYSFMSEIPFLCLSLW